MKKILFFIIFFLSVSSVYAYDCDYYYDKYDSYYNKYINSSYNDTNRQTYYNAYLDNNNKYNECYDEYENNYQNALSYYEIGNYSKAVDFFQKALKGFPNHKGTQQALSLSYFYLGYGLYEKGEYKEAIDNYRLAQKNGFEDLYVIYYNIGLSYYNLGNYESALGNFENALKETYDSQRIQEVQALIRELSDEKDTKDLVEELGRNAPTNDEYSLFQVYLNSLNIPVAWNKVTNNNQVTIAIIDDGIDINNSDLSNNIWINKREIPGDFEDNDLNGYIDDYSGVNFVDNDYGFISNSIPAGSHGTEVAGIIGAGINNYEGISGITKNVKLMNLRAFPLNGDGATDEDLIKALRYAIDNGANIINLSLSSENNLLAIYNNPEYNNIFEEAFKKNIPVVISAGNGDILSNQENGVNTSVNKVYPVCSENFYKHIIGVGALDVEGYRAYWSNYGDCVDFFVQGEGIATSSIKAYSGEDYIFVDGTSFSAPIITGIIGLGFNQYGKTSSEIIYDSLNESLIKNSVGNYVVDASKYIDVLGKKVGLKLKYKTSFSQKLGTKLSKFPIKSLNTLVTQINKYLVKDNLKEDLRAKLEALLELIEEEIANR